MSNKQMIFTILLVLLIVILISYLVNTSENTIDSTESFESQKLKNESENDEIVDEIINQENFTNELNSIENITESNNVPENDSVSDIQNESKIVNAPQVTVSQPEDAAESDTAEGESEGDSEGDSESDTLKLNKTSNVSKQVYNFKENDINNNNGAPIDSAFNILAKSSSKDKVDFKKNNVDKYDANDYLPQEINDKWFQTDFTNAKTVDDDSLINIKPNNIGVNTVGQSLKNASHDIRGTIANPKYSISPWNNSTYEADWNIKSLC